MVLELKGGSQQTHTSEQLEWQKVTILCLLALKETSWSFNQQMPYFAREWIYTINYIVDVHMYSESRSVTHTECNVTHPTPCLQTL